MTEILILHRNTQSVLPSYAKAVTLLTMVRSLAILVTSPQLGLILLHSHVNALRLPASIVAREKSVQTLDKSEINS